MIALPDTEGRIDHLAIDLANHRLFVAEIANGTVDEIDIEAGKVVGRVAGLSEPQGVVWLPAQQELVVAYGDGSVRFYPADRRELARIEVGDDADNVRVDPRNGYAIVGYGKGALAAAPFRKAFRPQHAIRCDGGNQLSATRPILTV